MYIISNQRNIGCIIACAFREILTPCQLCNKINDKEVVISGILQDGSQATMIIGEENTIFIGNAKIIKDITGKECRNNIKQV